MTWWDAITRKWKPPTPPVIKTVVDDKELDVTEWARKAAAMNMKLDPAKRLAVERLLQDKYGEQQGLAEARRRYPESYEN